MIAYCNTMLAGFNEFLLTIDTEIMEIFQKTQIFLKKYPNIRASIEEDLFNYSIDEKKKRLMEKEYEEAVMNDNNEVLFDSRIYSDLFTKLELKKGRPGMPVELIFFFMQVRGSWGSVSNRDASERLKDSKSIEAILAFHNYALPSVNAIRENLNKVSEKTKSIIMTSQAQYILENKLDNFKEIFADSTHVKANTAFPTDIDILYKLLARTLKAIESLPELGVPVVIASWASTRLDKMLKHLKYVNMNCSKGLKGKTKEEYRSFLKLSLNLIDDLKTSRDNAVSDWEKLEASPSERLALDMLWDKIEQDLTDSEYVHYYADLRINQDIKTPTKEKILSVSDRDAAYIKKGQREAVIGYRPQIARSENGFICGYLTPRGNAPDSLMLKPLINKAIAISGVVPDLVSVDDGYSSDENFKYLHDTLKIKTVSFGGSKGKKILEESWNEEDFVYGRKQRSAVESGMFTLKFNHDFGFCRRRGLEAVDAELTEKIIAYNFSQIIRIEKRKKLEEEARKLELMQKIKFTKLEKTA